MAKTYIPGTAADAIVDRLLAKGCYSTPEEAVRAGLLLLLRHDAEMDELMRRVDEREACVEAAAPPRLAPRPRLGRPA